MKKFINFICSDKLCPRLVWLGLATLASVGLFRCFREKIYFTLGVLVNNNGNNLIPIPAIDGVLIGLPVLLVLWCFRTRDIREQINQSQEQINKSQEQINQSQEQINELQTQIHQNNLAIGLNKLVGSDSLQLAIGVQILRQVSIETDEFDDIIRLAFIKRLQHLPTNLRYGNGNCIKSIPDRINIRQIPTLNYMPHIFDWLLEHAKRNQMDIESESIDVPEMFFAIQWLESTEAFLDLESSEFDKNIPLREMRNALEKYRKYHN